MVSVIIPCYNESQYIKSCIDSIVASTYKNIEIIVCDGLSNDGTIDVLKGFQVSDIPITILTNHARFTPQALNLGIENAKGEYIMILGSHSKIASNYIEKCLLCFDIDKNIGAVGGIIKSVSENEYSKEVSYCMSQSFGVGNAYFRTGNKSGYVDTVGFGIYKKAVFEKIGLFNEKLIRNQDDELNFRLMKAGFLMYLTTETQIEYFVRNNPKKLSNQYFQYGYWKVYVGKLHNKITTLRQVIPALFVLNIFVFIAQFLFLNSKFLNIAIASPLFFYVLLCFYFSSINCQNISSFFQRASTFIILHLSYGLGYWKGIIDFIIFGRNDAYKQMKETTR